MVKMLSESDAELRFISNKSAAVLAVTSAMNNLSNSNFFFFVNLQRVIFISIVWHLRQSMPAPIFNK
jgi:hypothetical protein